MLRLTLAAEGAASPVPVPEPDAPCVYVERSGAGSACALFQTIRDEHWIHVPALASYCFRPQAEEVTAYVEPQAPVDRVREAFDDYVRPLAMQAQGVEVLHASAVGGPGGVFAFCAQAGTGKSTLAYGLSERGWAHWADDWLTLERTDGRVQVLPQAFAAKLRAPSAVHYGVGQTETLLPVDRAGSGSHAPLAGVCVLERDEAAGAVQIDRLPAPLALRALLAHGCWFSPVGPERKRRMLEFYLALAAELPVWRVRFAPGLGQLGRLLDRLECLLRGGEAP